MKADMTEMKSDMVVMRADMTEMKSDMVVIKTDMANMKSEMNERFNAVEAVLDGIGGQCELTNESRINNDNFIVNKLNKLEKEVFMLKSKSNN
ncbi:SMC interacting uncharacterized protein involved in chromosome segregation [Bacillus tianshenii]|uniref:SMC interacting uncharacterized protein involved in chromosome segregation n=2 Tax=Sutcliffiella tianshenii TaxID=1463404 RepID=A0ABS2P049_9BACI|nr:SMC interacting uncharacterized protein involved in chromosome segregation [Bacillus tianshenii]